MYNAASNENMSIKPKFSRRDFLKLATVGSASAAVLAACGPRRREGQPSPEIINGGPSLPFFLAMSGMRLPEDPSRNAEAMAQLQKILSNPEQADNLLAVFIDNQLSVACK